MIAFPAPGMVAPDTQYYALMFTPSMAEPGATTMAPATVTATPTAPIVTKKKAKKVKVSKKKKGCC